MIRDALIPHVMRDFITIYDLTAKGIRDRAFEERCFVELLSLVAAAMFDSNFI